MNNEKTAHFILELRKSHNMTQRELADKLNVTDKAVSKWERGLSCPDISLLNPLAEILGVTTSELLNGERSETAASDIEMVVDTTLQYADTAAKSKSRDIRTANIFVLSVLFLLGIAVCTICDIAISGAFTWSLYPISAILFAWLLIVPIIKLGKNGVFVSLVFLSVLIIPFLFILSRILSSIIGKNTLLMPIAIPISVISIIYLWIIFILFGKLKLRKLLATAISTLFLLPVGALINFTIAKIIHEPYVDAWDIFAYILVVIFALLLFCADHFMHTKRR